jgi:predicted transcriptional regulator
MTNEYNYVTKTFLPALKSRVAKLLYLKYKFNQQEIAGLLDITQAEVSKYLSDKNAYSKSSIKFDEMKLEELAKNIKNKKEYRAQKLICSICPKGSKSECIIMIR